MKFGLRRNRPVTLLAVALTAVCLVAGTKLAPETISLPDAPDGLRFAVVGDTGTGDKYQRGIGDLMAQAHQTFPFTFAIMAGDNMYGGESSSAFKKKFEDPYDKLLKAGVKFYAALGNHDSPSQRLYEPFHMGGERYYAFSPRDDVEFFALDSTYMNDEQQAWIKKALTDSKAPWKIAFFHHPLYSSGERHGSELDLRAILEPIFLADGVDVVISGHDHFYERVNPQKGIYYFVVGGAAKLRRGNIDIKSGITAAGYDQGRSFMLAEIVGDRMFIEAIGEDGQAVDRFVIPRRD